MNDMLSILPLDLVGAVALASVFLAMTATAIGVEPTRILAQGVPARPMAAALVIALVVVPVAALALADAFALESGQLVGLLLMGISPGAPLALRKAGQAGGDAVFSVVLQVGVAVLAIGAVPVWIAILQAIYGREAGLSVLLLAKQVFLAQFLPLAFGLALRHFAPARALSFVKPMLITSSMLLLMIAVLVLLSMWRALLGLPLTAIAASACLTSVALLLAYAASGPSTIRRLSAGAICALRNPGIALLIASANGLPASSKVMIVAHVFVTAILLALYLNVIGRGAGDDGDTAGATSPKA